MHASSISIGDVTHSETLKYLFPLRCKDHGFCGAIANNGSYEAVVDVFRGSLVRAQVGASRGTAATLLHMDIYNHQKGMPSEIHKKQWQRLKIEFYKSFHIRHFTPLVNCGIFL